MHVTCTRAFAQKWVPRAWYLYFAWARLDALNSTITNNHAVLFSAWVCCWRLDFCRKTHRFSYTSGIWIFPT